MTTNGTAINVFIAYAHEDEALLRQLHTHLNALKRPGLIATWYDRELVAGTDWSRVIDAQLEQASIILLLVSADFLASNYCYEVEMTRALERHEAGQARVIPIALRPTAWKGLPFASLQALPTDARAVTSWDNQDEAFVNVVAGIRRAIEDLSLLPASTARASLPRIWNIPHSRNSFFLGRDEILARLHTQLQSGQTTALSQAPQAISGLGGIGKTQIALEYAYLHQQDYQAVLWAQAETRETLTASYLTLAALLNLPEKSEQESARVITAVKTWLQSRAGWLLVLDNADDLALAREFLPSSFPGHVLLTTRAQVTGRFARRLEVDLLSKELGTLFLLRRCGRLAPDASLEQAPEEERETACAICEELGGLPLALDQAGAYIEEMGCSLTDYQRLYQRHRADLLAERRGQLVDDHPLPVATTWKLSFEQVEGKHPAAADLLRLCAFLAPDAIPAAIITSVAEYPGSTLAPIVTDPYLLNPAIEALRAYSLLHREASSGAILSVHRLVQTVLRDQMDEQSRRQWAERAIRAINAVFPRRGSFEHWEMCALYLPHVQAAFTYGKTDKTILPELANLLRRAGWYLGVRGQYREAEELLPQALALQEQTEDTNGLAMALIAVTLGWLYNKEGKYAEAEPLYQRALAIYEQELGGQHPSTATSLNNLAQLYKAQGKYSEAEPLYQRALSIWERTLGADHPHTRTGRGNYAALLRAMGREEEARRVEEGS